jgi:hypothetical protein
VNAYEMPSLGHYEMRFLVFFILKRKYPWLCIL